MKSPKRMKSWRILIYGLIDPRTARIRYIGKSSSGMKRPKQHLGPKAHSRDRTPIGFWIRKLRDLGLVPTIVVVEDLGTSSQKDQANELLNEAEIRWIATKREAGEDLLNATDGGDGLLGHEKSEETLQKYRDWRKRMGPNWSGMKGKRHTDEAIQNMRVAQAKRAGRLGPDGTIIPKPPRERKIRDQSGERNPFFGMKHSEEFRQRMRDREVSQETKDRIRASKVKKVRCLDDGLIFDSVKLASKYYSISEAAIAACARGARVNGSAKGRKFKYDG